VGTLKIALQNYGDGPCEQPKVALIALTIRNKDTFEQFLNHTQEAALLLEDIELEFHATSFLETVDDMESCRNVRLFRIKSIPNR